MGCTERSEYINNFDDVVKYLETRYNFHDYRIGHLFYDGKRADITVEEVIPGKKLQDSTGLIWDFHFEDVTSFQISADCVLRFWILEVKKGNKPNEVLFNLGSGEISVVSNSIRLGIPSKE